MKSGTPVHQARVKWTLVARIGNESGDKSGKRRGAIANQAHAAGKGPGGVSRRPGYVGYSARQGSRGRSGPRRTDSHDLTDRTQSPVTRGGRRQCRGRAHARDFRAQGGLIVMMKCGQPQQVQLQEQQSPCKSVLKLRFAMVHVGILANFASRGSATLCGNNSECMETVRSSSRRPAQATPEIAAQVHSRGGLDPGGG